MAAGSRSGAIRSTAGVSALRRSPHADSEPCGSRSIIKTFSPEASAATPTAAASVDLPVPPLEFTNAMVFIAPHPRSHVTTFQRHDAGTRQRHHVIIESPVGGLRNGFKVGDNRTARARARTPPCERPD